MITFVAPPPLELAEVFAPEEDPFVLFLSLEQPEIAAARIAVPATAIVSSRFTCAPLPI
jgi:hypothetical protein